MYAVLYDDKSHDQRRTKALSRADAGILYYMGVLGIYKQYSTDTVLLYMYTVIL